MKVYHQTGHGFSWNLDCYKDGFGDGLIFSPINIDADKLSEKISDKIKTNSFLDPQLYLINQAKGTLETYPYFPGNIKSDFSTLDLDQHHIKLAKLCLDFQLINKFKYLVIPTRYNEDNPTNFLNQSRDYFVLPFCDYAKEIGANKKILLSIIIKPIMLTDEEKRNETLNWITGHQSIDGVYIIFENNFSTKQIKDYDYLINALRLINILKENQMEVHIGYCNTEAILYTIAMPDSVSMGAYENLRSFGIKRFQDNGNGRMRPPNARLYSSKLFQWIDYGYIQSMKALVKDYENYFDSSQFNPLTTFKPTENWQFKKTEPYKHYFHVFYAQLKDLPSKQSERMNVLEEKFKIALNLFSNIQERVILDENSDGSHLPTWINVLNVFKNEKNQ